MYCTEHCTYDLIPETLLGAHGTAESSAPRFSHFQCALYLNLNLNLNSLLVKRQIDNPSPGAVTGGN